MKKELEDKLFTIDVDGKDYDVPAKIIAKNRADYYTERDGNKIGSTEWQEEYEFSLEDDELHDWYYNNMDFSDVEEFIVLPTATIREGWDEAGKTGKVLGSEIKVNSTWWTPVLWDGEEDPDFFKTKGLKIK